MTPGIWQQAATNRVHYSGMSWISGTLFNDAKYHMFKFMYVCRIHGKTPLLKCNFST